MLLSIFKAKMPTFAIHSILLLLFFFKPIFDQFCSLVKMYAQVSEIGSVSLQITLRVSMSHTTLQVETFLCIFHSYEAVVL